MGNTLNYPTEKDSSTIESKDNEYLELSCSSIYNDEYVSNIYRNLPNFDELDNIENLKKKPIKKSKLLFDDINNDSTIHNLMNVFSKRPEHIPIESFSVSSTSMTFFYINSLSIFLI